MERLRQLLADKIWPGLRSIRDRRAPAAAVHVAENGPLAINAGETIRENMEAVAHPGTHLALEHCHSGPKPVLTCGEHVGRHLMAWEGWKAGASHHVIVPAGPPMHLDGNRTVQRKALVLILHYFGKPPHIT